jgi:hypothetical protein
VRQSLQLQAASVDSAPRRPQDSEGSVLRRHQEEDLVGSVRPLEQRVAVLAASVQQVALLRPLALVVLVRKVRAVGLEGLGQPLAVRAASADSVQPLALPVVSVVLVRKARAGALEASVQQQAVASVVPAASAVSVRSLRPVVSGVALAQQLRVEDLEGLELLGLAPRRCSNHLGRQRTWAWGWSTLRRRCRCK